MKNAGIATGIFEGGYKRAPDPGQIRGRFESEIRFRRLISETPESKIHPPRSPVIQGKTRNPKRDAGLRVCVRTIKKIFSAVLRMTSNSHIMN